MFCFSFVSITVKDRLIIIKINSVIVKDPTLIATARIDTTQPDYDNKAVGGIQKLTTQTGESNLVFGAIVPDAE